MRAQRPGQSALLLVDAIEILNQEHVEYAVVGAFALAVHGVVRASMDADALLYITPRRLIELHARFEQSGFGAELRQGNTDDPIPAILRLSDNYGNRVDLLAGLRGLDPHVFSRAVEVVFCGEHLRIVGREDFIAMKCFAGGPQDLVDARSAYESGNTLADVDLLRSVTRRFGSEAVSRLEQILGAPLG
jgi:predicted nucleotidyltransferase